LAAFRARPDASPVANGLGLLSRPGTRQAVALEHPVEGAPVDAEDRCRAAHVAPALLEDLSDVTTLQLRERRPVRGLARRQRGPAVLLVPGADLARQILGGEDVVLGELDGPLERVRQRASVARPVVRAEEGQRRLGGAG